MFIALKTLIISVLLATAGLFGYEAPQLQTPPSINYEAIFGAFTPTGGGTYRLQSSLGSSDTSISLSSFKEPVSNIKYTMAYLNSTIEYGTIEPSNSSKKEFVSFSGITQNANGTATLTGVTRGLGFSYPYTASTTLQQTHSGQSIFILSNPPQLTNKYANKDNDEAIVGLWNFNSYLPVSTITATSGTQFATKSYADNVIAGGAATSSETLGGKVRLATQNQMASSTDGGVDDPAALYSKYSTSTQPIGCGTNCKYIPITQNNGQLDPTFINQQTLTLGTTTVNASSTFIGQVNIASSTTINAIKYTWPTNTTIASSSVLTMTTATGTVAWLAPEFGLIGEAVLNAANATLQVDFPARQDLHVVIDVLNNTTDVTVIRFNGDTGSNYTATTTATALFDFSGPLASTHSFITIDINNTPAANAKLLSYEPITFDSSNVLRDLTAAASPAAASRISGAWLNTSAQITRITVTRLAGNTMMVGSRIRVYGSSK